MTDKIQQAIKTGEITPDTISFEYLRDMAKAKIVRNGHKARHEALDRGRAIITDPELIAQYWYSHSLMIQQQWNIFLASIDPPPGRLLLIDYGCGQGLGGVLLFDRFKDLRERIDEIRLIEPSKLAIESASSILSCYCRNAELNLLNKYLDELSEEDLSGRDGTSTLHLMSNILDIDDFDVADLFSKMFSSNGRHDLFAVSHDRSFHGGSARFLNMKEQVHNSDFSKRFKVIISCLKRYKIPKNRKTISWHLQVESLNGSF